MRSGCLCACVFLCVRLLHRQTCCNSRGHKITIYISRISCSLCPTEKTGGWISCWITGLSEIQTCLGKHLCSCWRDSADYIIFLAWVEHGWRTCATLRGRLNRRNELFFVTPIEKYMPSFGQNKNSANIVFQGKWNWSSWVGCKRSALLYWSFEAVSLCRCS